VANAHEKSQREQGHYDILRGGCTFHIG
jgi:hypothetical protein